MGKVKILLSSWSTIRSAIVRCWFQVTVGINVKETGSRDCESWRVCEQHKESCCYYSNLARCYQEKNCQLRILDGTKAAFKNESSLGQFDSVEHHTMHQKVTGSIMLRTRAQVVGLIPGRHGTRGNSLMFLSPPLPPSSPSKIKIVGWMDGCEITQAK